MQLIDMIWVLICTSLIFLMQAGFCCLESGMVRSKNGINVAVKNILDFCISSSLFWLVGFGLMYGSDRFGLFGTTHFVLSSSGGTWLTVFFLFQLVFCGTATTIIAGAVAERMRLNGYIIIVSVTSLIIYPIFGHWVWGGTLEGYPTGWLKALGFIDFAGASVVHSVGGWTALAAIIIIGPRIGRFGKDALPIQGHNLPMATLGALVLGFGWMGFNGGSTLAITDQVPRILMNTFISGIFGGIAAVIISMRLLGCIEVRYLINGFLAGLVASTAACFAVDAAGAMIIGAGAGLVAISGALLLVKLKIDDAIDAVSTHAFAGSWGILSVAFFADESVVTPLGGRWELFQVQLIGTVVCFLWAFGVSWVLFKLISCFFNFRVTRAQEVEGLNISEHRATTESSDLLLDMEAHRLSGDFSSRVFVEPNTETGLIAKQYNDVLTKVECESNVAQKAVERAHSHIEDLRFISDISNQINLSETIDDALNYTLERIFKHIGWDFGHVFILDSETQTLVSSHLHYASDEGRFEDFLRVTLPSMGRASGSLIAQVFDSGAPLWRSNVVKDPNYWRKAAGEACGLHTLFAFPVMAGNKTVAVLELYSIEELEADPGLLGVMCEVGIQLGRVFERNTATKEQERVERDLSLAQKLESVGRLAAGVAHEINTPVQYVSDNTRFLDEAFTDLFELQKAQATLLDAARKGSVEPGLITAVDEAIENADVDYLMEETPKAITQALEGTARIAKIVGAMKQFSHPGSDTKKITSINDTLESTLTVSSTEWKYVANVVKYFDPDLPSILCFPGELGQVFLNLIVNAAHAIADVVGNDERQKGVIRLATSHVDNGVEIRIGDTGPGIPDSYQDKLFDSFFTTKEVGKGTGQGLAIARTVVVDLHGGSIDFETEVGVGTTFIIRLPIGQDDALSTQE